MIADLSIIPVGGSKHTSDLLARVLTLIADSGLRYQLTPTTTCVEGSWQQISDVARRCHELARADCAHVVTLLRIEDDADGGAKLLANTTSVEEKAGREFAQSPGEAMARPATLAEMVGGGQSPA